MTILRIIFTLITAYLLQISGLRLIGGLLLLYICYRLYVDVVKDSSADGSNIKVDNSSFFKAITTVIIADVTMSLDNVLGVAGAAGEHYTLLAFVFVLSIFLLSYANDKAPPLTVIPLLPAPSLVVKVIS